MQVIISTRGMTISPSYKDALTRKLACQVRETKARRPRHPTRP
jgi:hypothetical protein